MKTGEEKNFQNTEQIRLNVYYYGVLVLLIHNYQFTSHMILYCITAVDILISKMY